MKKLMFIIPLAAALILTGCGTNNKNPDTDVQNSASVSESVNTDNTAPTSEAVQQNTNAPRNGTEKPSSPAPMGTPTSQNGSDKISVDEAKSIAFRRAGVTEADVRDLDIDLERDRYEIDFEAGGNEYEVDINASSGEVIWFESEPDRY